MPVDSLASLRARIGARLAASAGSPDSGLSSTGSLRSEVSALVSSECPLLAPESREMLIQGVLADAEGLGVLEAAMSDPAVTEIMLNGPGPVWIERHGRLECLDLMVDALAIDHIIEKVVAPLGLRADRSCPIVDARLPDGSRVNAVVPPLAIDGPCVTIRRFGAREVPLADFATPGTIALLVWAIGARLNLLVCGGTGSGKTTLLNALAAHIPDGERVVTVEDAAELRLPGTHVVRLEARPANAEGAGQTRIRDLVRNALRMRPDRIVVGEVRGPEALDMLQAMNTGHEGSMSTCHANGPDDALRRVETMVLMDEVRLPLAAVQAQLEASVDLVVVVARAEFGHRRIVAVAEVIDHGWGGQPLGRPGVEPEAATSGRRTRLLADARGLRALPTRPPRSVASAPADPSWIELPA